MLLRLLGVQELLALPSPITRGGDGRDILRMEGSRVHQASKVMGHGQRQWRMLGLLGNGGNAILVVLGGVVGGGRGGGTNGMGSW